MRIDTYEFEQRPGKQGSPPRRSGRVAVDATYGGAVAHSSPGHLSDAVFSLGWPMMDALPAKTVLREVAAETTAAAQITASGQAIGCRLDVSAGAFAAISAVSLRLRKISATGTLSVEVWDSAGSGPQTKVGLLGVIDIADIPDAWGDVPVWSDVAWPLFSPGGYLVLNGAGLTAGTVAWAGSDSVDNYYKYTPAGGWSQQTGRPSGTFWQGSQFFVLRGLCGAYCYPGGDGPQLRTLQLDDGHRYSIKLMDVSGQYHIAPLDMDSRGIVDSVRADLVVVEEQGEQGLTPAP